MDATYECYGLSFLWLSYRLTFTQIKGKLYLMGHGLINGAFKICQEDVILKYDSHLGLEGESYQMAVCYLMYNGCKS
jgi:hypothetical protein